MKPQTLVFEFFSNSINGVDKKAVLVHSFLFFTLWTTFTIFFVYIASAFGKLAAACLFYPDGVGS